MKVTDQIGRAVQVSTSPKRIVSLVPSQTELLEYLGLESEVIGITKFCIYPKNWYESKQRVGGTKNIDIKLVASLNPDLIIGNKEENTIQDITALQSIAPTWVSDVNSFDEALHMINNIGLITNRQTQATLLIQKIEEHFVQLELHLEKKKNKSVLYFIWNDPDFVVGRETFINAMIEKAGYKNACLDARYPEYPKDVNPDLVFLSSEPFPFKEVHRDKFQKLFPKAKIHLVDGEMFSWYGSRMLKAPEYFRELAEITLK